MPKRIVELLSPAQDAASGKAAVRAGADAVYIGGPRFGARSKATNSIEEIASLCDYAHLFNVRVYATLNTLLHDKDLTDAERIARELHEAGIDALIIQDMSWLTLNLPGIPLHASTQTDNRTVEKVGFLHRSGCDRVVLARELSIESIASIHRALPGVELEAFVHGALCVCYSGQCYLSQKLFGRSANRGECAQACRLPYRIEDTHGHTLRECAYALSLHDLNLADHLEALIDAGVSSLKIEGRMKGINYVENVTAYYHQRLNTLLARRKDLQRPSHGRISIPFTADPRATFARPFTTYFATGRPARLANLDTPKSVGEFIGEVRATGKNWIEVENGNRLTNGDGILLVSHGKAMGCRVNRVERNRLYPFGLNGTPMRGDRVFRNANVEFEEALQRHPATRTLEIYAEMSWDGEGDATLTARDAQGVSATLRVGEPLERAERPEKQAAIWAQQMLKATGTPIRIVTLSWLAGSHVPFMKQSSINALRQNLIENYLKAKMQAYRQPLPKARKTATTYPPTLPTDGRLNVSNKLSELFYATHGVANPPPALDILQEIPPEMELMRTKYCLRHELSLCPRQAPSTKAEPLTLTTQHHRLLAEFDCARCEMTIKTLPDARG